MYVINYFPFGYKYFPFGYKYFPFAFDYYFPFAFDYFPRLSRKSRFELNRILEWVCDYVDSIEDLDTVLNEED